MVRKAIGKGRSLQVLAVLLWLALALTGCATGQGTGTTLIVTGETLKAVGNQFVVVGAAYKQGCDVAKTITQDRCQKFRVFGLRFKEVYPLSVDLWELARKAGDPTSEKKASGKIVELSTELATFAVGVITTVGGK